MREIKTCVTKWHFKIFGNFLSPRLLTAFFLFLVSHAASAESIHEQVNIAHRYGLEMNELIEGCLIEMKVYHDIYHADCKAFIKAGNIYMAAREKVTDHLYNKGIINKGASTVEEIGAIGSITKSESSYGVIVGWNAMDRFLDRVQLLD